LCKGFIPFPKKQDGYQQKIANLRNKHKGKRCFIIGNGPSLKKMDLTLLKDEITIGCNAIYTHFKKMGYSTTYWIMEDVVQFEKRRKDIKNIEGSIKFAALHNAYNFKADDSTIFFNASPVFSLYNDMWRDGLIPQFSKDFSSVVYLGGTIAYIMIQLAYFLGCDTIYLIGIDHNYGILPKIFPLNNEPHRSVTVTEENYDQVQKCHFDKKYYKIGDSIGIPNIRMQELAYNLAKKYIEEEGRKIINAGIDSKLGVFPKVNYELVMTSDNE